MHRLGWCAGGVAQAHHGIRQSIRWSRQGGLQRAAEPGGRGANRGGAAQDETTRRQEERLNGPHLHRQRGLAGLKAFIKLRLAHWPCSRHKE